MGALPKLEYLSIGSPSAELKSACEAQRIEISDHSCVVY